MLSDSNDSYVVVFKAVMLTRSFVLYNILARDLFLDYKLSINPTRLSVSPHP
jgi:hypothetical protein